MPAAPPVRPRRRAAGAALLLLTALPAACASDDQARQDAAGPRDRPPIYESRTGVPLLMDLPLIGWLFQRRVTAR